MSKRKSPLITFKRSVLSSWTLTGEHKNPWAIEEEMEPQWCPQVSSEVKHLERGVLGPKLTTGSSYHNVHVIFCILPISSHPHYRALGSINLTAGSMSFSKIWPFIDTKHRPRKIEWSVPLMTTSASETPEPQSFSQSYPVFITSLPFHCMFKNPWGSSKAAFLSAWWPKWDLS